MNPVLKNCLHYSASRIGDLPFFRARFAALRAARAKRGQGAGAASSEYREQAARRAQFASFWIQAIL